MMVIYVLERSVIAGDISFYYIYFLKEIIYYLLTTLQPRHLKKSHTNSQRGKTCLIGPWGVQKDVQSCCVPLFEKLPSTYKGLYILCTLLCTSHLPLAKILSGKWVDTHSILFKFTFHSLFILIIYNLPVLMFIYVIYDFNNPCNFIV